jgi:NitT/TauT family transport system ATP-binding protein
VAPVIIKRGPIDAPSERRAEALRGGRSDVVERSVSDEGLHIKDVSISFRVRQRDRTADSRRRVLDNVNLAAKRGDFITIIGPSGCGKSTLLGSIAGIVDYDSGSISIDGEQVNGPSRHTAVVFQQASLLAWRTVQRNVEYGMELQGVARSERRARASSAIRLVGLGDFTHYYPHELSGGMQQRVNLARAWALDPTVLLMDEPFGQLDAMTRSTMQHELLELATGARIILFVTHDVSEAVLLGDRVVVMSSEPGRIDHVVDVDIPRPRSHDVEYDPRFLQAVARLRVDLRAS